MVYMENSTPVIHHRSDIPGVDFTHCTHEGCAAEFCWVPGREFPTLCIDHADDASRAAHGWTVNNSTN